MHIFMGVLAPHDRAFSLIPILAKIGTTKMVKQISHEMESDKQAVDPLVTRERHEFPPDKTVDWCKELSRDRA